MPVFTCRMGFAIKNMGEFRSRKPLHVFWQNFTRWLLAASVGMSYSYSMKHEMSNIQSVADSYGRTVRYLRLSVTDRCNLSCMYCSDTERQNFIPHEKIMRYERFLRLAAIAAKMGVGKIRITGGEPFARKGCMDLLRSLRSSFPQLLLAITTNATLIGDKLKDLADLKPYSINISLDSFNERTFHRITGHNLYAEALANIEGLLKLGQRVKLNAVLLKGITDSEADDFAHAVRNMPVDIRFIEFMPMGSRTQWSKDIFLSAAEMRERLSAHLALSEVLPAKEESALAGPARMFSAQGAQGRVGFISALSNHFCRQCNRMRVTSDGMLRTCLFSDREYRLAPMLASAKVSDEASLKLLNAACAAKPLGEELLKASHKREVAKKEMVGIGG